MSRGEINVDPIEGEFFTTEALGSLSDALVREAIQNSLDAAIPGEQVRVVISFSDSTQRPDSPKKDIYLKGLDTHLGSRNTGLTDQVKLTYPMDYILLEDFGTRSLEGDINQDEDTGNYPKGPFLY